MALYQREQDTIAGISAARIYDHVLKMCSFGSRCLGSPGHEQTKRYLAEELATQGMDVEYAPFEIAIPQKTSAELKVLSPDLGIPCRANYRSAPTPSGGIVCDRIVDVGTGMEAGYAGKDVRGAVVLAWESGGHPVPKSELAAQKGALACIWVNSRSGGLIATYGLGRFGSKLPIVSVSYEDGQLLRQRAAAGTLRISLRVETELEKGTGEHVIGILRGRQWPEEIYILCAHYETVPGTVGANDNAAGVGVVLEAARALSAYHPNRTVWFLLSTGEEGGAPGLRAYVDANAPLLAKVKAIFNLDVLSEGSTLRYVTEGQWPDRAFQTSDRLNRLMVKAAEDMGYMMLPQVSHMGLADAEPFVAAGVPGAWIEKAEWRYMHTALDVPETVDANAAKVAADIIAISVMRLDQDRVD